MLYAILTNYNLMLWPSSGLSIHIIYIFCGKEKLREIVRKFHMILLACNMVFSSLTNIAGLAILWGYSTNWLLFQLSHTSTCSLSHNYLSTMSFMDYLPEQETPICELSSGFTLGSLSLNLRVAVVDIQVLFSYNILDKASMRHSSLSVGLGGVLCSSVWLKLVSNASILFFPVI